MAYDEGLAQRIREVLGERDDIEEKKMFGGLSFLLNGNMSVGVIKDDLCVRADPERYDDLLARPGAREFDFTGRPMKGWLMVAPEGLEDDEALRAWVDESVRFAASLPAKQRRI